MISRQALRIAFAVALALPCGSARAVTSKTHAVDDAIQVMADLTEIDHECRDLDVNFGVGLEAAAQSGLVATTIMPTGAKRPAFETALRVSAAYTDETICGALAHHYSIALPGSVTFSVPATREK